MRRIAIILIGLLTLLLMDGCATKQQSAGWPAPTAEMRPWTRWWWMGSAVDHSNLSELLKTYHDAGLGGVEICPIYGAKGYELRYLKFLSPQWVDALDYTEHVAHRLGMGVDLTTGTGWPFGGPNVSRGDASMRIVDIERAATTQPIQKVKRAAPGGEGYVLNPFSAEAMGHYVQRFDTNAQSQLDKIRAEFHDSFEYFGADWTPKFFADFQRLRGYDLHPYLSQLAGQGDLDVVARLKHDYRETISDLHLEYLKAWVDWSHSHHSLARNQAHGSPTNLIDAYAIADIPETEIFRQPDDSSRVMLMFASSAAHLADRPLASSESFTWLGEHFQTSLADCKPAADLLFTSGINHIFLHGIAYSPRDVPWPGWLFYASTDFAPQAGLWHDAPAFFAYITRIQSMLQSSRPDTDVLLYFPVHDIWQDPDGMLKPLTVHDQNVWLYPSAFYKTAKHLLDRGYAMDFVSDKFIAGAFVKDKQIRIGNHAYRSLVIPRTMYMPAETAEKLAELSRNGAKIIFSEALPKDVPGFDQLESRRLRLKRSLDGMLISADLPSVEKQITSHDEFLASMKLRFTRRATADGHLYFISNPTSLSIQGWAPLATPATSALLMDPMFENRIGLAAIHLHDGAAEIYLQLEPGQSIIVRTFDHQVTAQPWPYYLPLENTVPIRGSWRVQFVEGGPVLPRSYNTTTLSSWTNAHDPESKRFAGTARYSIDFYSAPGKFLLDLGKVCESARVSLNGEQLGTLWAPPYQIVVSPRNGRNHLEVEVTNLPANRIADLDRRHVPWKSFHEINFVNRDYRPFDASHWPLRDSGLLGPVTLTPLQPLEPK